MHGIDTRTVEFGLAVLALLILLTVGFRLVKHLRAVMSEPDIPTKAELLDSFQEAYDTGQMDSAEYRRACALVENDPAALGPATRKVPSSPASQIRNIESGHATTPETSPAESPDQ